MERLIQRETKEETKIEILKLTYTERWNEIRFHREIAYKVFIWLIVLITGLTGWFISHPEYSQKGKWLMPFIATFGVAYLFRNYQKFKRDMEKLVKIDTILGFFEEGIYGREPLLPERNKDPGKFIEDPIGVITFSILLMLLGIGCMLFIS